MPQSTFEDVIKSLYSNKGFTFSLNTLELNPKHGYSVAINKDGEFILPAFSRYKRNAVEYKIKEYVNSHLGSLQGIKNRFVGGWVEGNRLYLDVVEITDNKAEAEKLAVERSQEAYFDNSKRETVFIN